MDKRMYTRESKCYKLVETYFGWAYFSVLIEKYPMEDGFKVTWLGFMLHFKEVHPV